MPVWFILATLIVTVLSATPAPANRCPLAPAPRLHPGLTAVVAPGLWGLNLRALPALSTGVRVQISAGQRMTVLDGPSCNGHYQWYRVELPNGVSGWIAEGSWREYFLVPATTDGTARSLVSPAEWSCRERFDPRRCPLFE